MRRTMTVAVLMTAVVAPAAAQYNGNRATLGNCQIAILQAQRNGNVWNAPFEMDECARIAAQAIDDGQKMIEKSQAPDRRGRSD
jgi:hypothetical protein